MQPFFESLHRIGIRGMNYMQSQFVDKTGEIGAVKFAMKKHNESYGWVVFDIGANEGQFVREAAKIFEKPFQIHSFEPSSAAFEKLILNTQFGNVHFYNIGFGQKSKKVALYCSGTLTGSVYPISSGDDGIEWISITSIENFCLEQNIDKIFYMKIDVEGAEMDVLKGCETLIKEQKIYFVQFEYGPNCVKSKVFLKDFFELLCSYTIYRIVKNGLRKIRKYDEILEIPLTSNFLAELNA